MRRWDPETHHILNQYTASLIQSLCALTGSCWPHVGSVSLAPHPAHGVEHLRPWLGERVTASTIPVMEIEIADRVLDAPLRIEALAPLAPVPAGEWQPIVQDMGLIGSLKLVLAAMLRGGTPTIERLARAADVSVRTLQRRLQDEGSSFSRLLDDTRRELALRAIGSGPASFAEVAENLGYSQQSSLSRSVRRWSGSRPRDLRLPEEAS